MEDAAGRAVAALAFEHAAGLYATALDLSGAAGAPRKRLLLLLAEAQANARRGAEAARSYLEAAGLAEGLEELDLRRRAGQLLLVSGRIEEALEVLRPVLAAVGLSMAPTARAALLRLAMGRIAVRLRGLRVRTRAQDEISRRDLLRLDVCGDIAQYLAHFDTLHALDFQTRALREALRLGEPMRVMRSLVMEASYSAVADGLRGRRRSDRLQRRADALAAAMDAPRARALADIGRAFVAFFQGRFRVAASGLAPTLEFLRARCTDVQWEINEATFFHLLCLEFIGEIPAMRARAGPALDDAARRGDHHAEILLRTRTRYVLHLMDDAPERVADDVARLPRAWQRSSFDIPQYYVVQGEVDIGTYLREPRRARVALAESARAYGRSLLERVDILDATMSLIRARSALCAAADGGCAPAELRALRAEALHFARRLARGRGAYQVAWSVGIRAGVAALDGDSRRTLELLRTAEDAFLDADMPLYAEVVRLRRGEVLGGETGRDIVAESTAALAARTVKNPARWADLYAPGFRR